MLKILESDGNELEIENKVLKDITFESETTAEAFIEAIKVILPQSFNYKIVTVKEDEQE